MSEEYLFPYILREKTFDKYINPKIESQSDLNFIKSLYKKESKILIFKNNISKKDKNKAVEIFKGIGFNIIADGNILYRYVNPLALPVDQKEIPPAIFMDGELSCDWERYCEEPLKSIHVQQGKTIILVIHICEEIRNPQINGQMDKSRHQDIFHDPVENDPGLHDNYAHSLIAGKKRNPVAENISENTEFYTDYLKRNQRDK